MNIRFYQCKVCKKVIAVMSDTDIPTVCCGEVMAELVPNMTDGAAEKHVPVLRREGNAAAVYVGSAPHPMTAEHSIIWIGLRTERGFQFRELKPEDLPKAGFFIDPEDQVQAVYAFCNLHGLWCAEM